jgi:hypothetical protein
MRDMAGAEVVRQLAGAFDVFLQQGEQGPRRTPSP